MKSILAATLFLLITTVPAAATEVIAEPGGHQPSGGDAARCTATPDLPAGHPPVDETLSAVGAAFEARADWVALDLRVNGDGQLTVSHSPSCQTSGTVPSLREVLTAFPDGRFLLDMKGGPRGAADTMIDYLKAAVAGGLVRSGRLMVYSSSDPAINARAGAALPGLAVPGLVMSDAADCLTEYGQRGVFPRACYGAEIPLSIGALRNMGDYAADVIKAVHAVRARVHVLDVNSADGYRFAAALEPDFIWTDRVEALGL